MVRKHSLQQTAELKEHTRPVNRHITDHRERHQTPGPPLLLSPEQWTRSDNSPISGGYVFLQRQSIAVRDTASVDFKGDLLISQK